MGPSLSYLTLPLLTLTLTLTPTRTPQCPRRPGGILGVLYASCNSSMLTSFIYFPYPDPYPTASAPLVRLLLVWENGVSDKRRATSKQSKEQDGGSRERHTEDRGRSRARKQQGGCTEGRLQIMKS